MELRHLRYFVAVAEELNFTRAAQRLHIGQPPLSQQIQALEAELGVCLFERTKRRVALTAAGQRLFERAATILGDTARAVEEAQRIARGELGELRIGFTSSLPFTALLPTLIRRYRDQYPNVTLRLRERFSADQYLALEQDQLDIGFVRYTGLSTPPGIEVQKIHRDPLRVVLPAAHPLAGRPSVALAELRDEGFISYPPGIGTGLTAHLAELCAAAGFQPRIVQVAAEATTQIGLVAAGLGLALLPSPLECVHIDGVRYLPLSDPGAYLSLGLALRKGVANPLVAAFLANLPEAAGEGALANEPKSFR